MGNRSSLIRLNLPNKKQNFRDDPISKTTWESLFCSLFFQNLEWIPIYFWAIVIQIQYEKMRNRKITYLVRFHTVQSILKISRFRLDLCFEICASIALAIRGQWYILACEFWTVRSADFGSSECNFWYDFLYYSHFVNSASRERISYS